MGKPTKDVFDEWFALEKEQPAIHLLNDLASVPLGIANGSVVISSFGRLIEEKIREAFALYDLHLLAQVRQWADSQPGFLKAKALLDKYASRQDSDLWLSRFIERAEKESEPRRLKFTIEGVFSEGLAHYWGAKLYRALHEYHYTDTATRMYEIVQHGPKAIDAIVDAIDRGQAYLDDMQELLGIGMSGLPRVVNRLRDVSFAHLPIQRNTRFKSEHLFVSRIRRANLDFARRPKPDVIVELMTMDGFARQFDERTIERICARLKEQARRTARRSTIDLKVAGAVSA
jgi:hypothetical protein